MNEIEQNIKKSENIQDPIHSQLSSGLTANNYKETNAVFNWDTGTKTMLGIDDNDLPHLISEEPSEEINEIKQAVDNNQEVSQGMLEKIPGMLGGIKKWSMSSTKGDWYKSLEKAGFAFSDFLEQGSRLITGGKIRELFDDQPRILRKDNITLNLTNEDIKNGFMNMQEDFQPGAENHPFNEDGNLKEGWQEISQSVAASDAIQYDNQEFSPAPMFEYILQYGLGGKKIYDVLGNVSKLKNAPIIKAVLAELGVEFVGATQKKDDVNMLNILEGFGIGDQSGTVLNILRESLAAGDDDTVFERKYKNATANAPLGLGIGLTFKTIAKTKALYNMLKKFKFNKEGRTELSKKLGLSIANDNGVNGTFKVEDKNGITIASFATKQEADELKELLGEGHEVQEIKSLGAAAVEPRGLIPSEKPFYSNVENAISNMTMKSGNGDQILATLNNTSGIKQSEIEDLGLNEFLAGKKKVTKEELDDFIADKSLTTRVKDTFLEGSPGERVNDIDFADGVQEEFKNAYDFDEAKLIVYNDEGLYNELTEFGLAKGISEDDMMSDDFVTDFLESQYGMTRSNKADKPTRFDNETLPGGKDYKEILITAPGTPQVYTKHHFKGDVPDGENLIAHARFNTREINGKKTLFIEEIQSDLHQAGRKEGYNTKDAQKAQSEFDQYSLFLADKYDLPPQQNLAMYGGLKNMTDAEVNKYQLLQSKVNFSGIADAPFKKNWHELTMKRLIKYAVDNDFEAISFTPGSVQNKRYELSQVVNKIQVTPSYRSKNKITLYTYDKNNLLQAYHILPEQLKDYVGKDLSAKILKDKENSDLFKNFDFDEFNSKNVSEQDLLDKAPTYREADLEIGGEGMKGFYDNMLPTFLKKFGKKYNAKLEKTNMSKTGSHENLRYGFDDIDINKKYDAIGRDGKIFATYQIYGLEDAVIVQQIKDGTSTILFEGGYRSATRVLREELEGFPVPQILEKSIKTNKVPFMVITPEMKKDILTKGVPIAKVDDREEKTSAVA